MNKEQFSKILKDPDKADDMSIPLLKDLLDQFPYFQTARMLRLKLLKDENSVLYRKDLKNTSAYAGDRTKLFHFINGGDLKQMQESAKMGLPEDKVAEEEQQLINDQQAAIQPASSIEPKLTDEISEEIIPEVEQHDEETTTRDHVEIPDVKPNKDFEGITELPYLSETGLTPQEILEKRLNEIKNEKEQSTVEPEMTGDASVADNVEVEDPPLSEESHELGEAESAEDPVRDFEMEEKSRSQNSFELEDRIVEAQIDDSADTSPESAAADESTIPDLSQTEPIEEVIPNDSNFVDASEEVEQQQPEEPVTSSQAQDISFVSWLGQLNKKGKDPSRLLIVRIEAPSMPEHQSVEEDRSQQKDIIDHFIKTNPRIERKKAEFYSATDMAKRSIQDQNELVSETLAKVYADQGLTAQAIAAYQQLCLKYPQKKAYFAARIKEINDSGSIK